MTHCPGLYLIFLHECSGQLASVHTSVTFTFVKNEAHSIVILLGGAGNEVMAYAAPLQSVPPVTQSPAEYGGGMMFGSMFFGMGGNPERAVATLKKAAAMLRTRKSFMARNVDELNGVVKKEGGWMRLEHHRKIFKPWLRHRHSRSGPSVCR